jgi:hypothetical protein
MTGTNLCDDGVAGKLFARPPEESADDRRYVARRSAHCSSDVGATEEVAALGEDPTTPSTLLPSSRTPGPQRSRPIGSVHLDDRVRLGAAIARAAL